MKNTKMSVSLRLSFLTIVISLSIISFIPSQQAASPDVAIYWGQNSGEGSLADKCSSGYYNYVMMSYLTNYSQGHTPTLNLAGHCDPASPGSCIYLGEQIKACQNQDIKVFLSLGDAEFGPPDPINSTEYAYWLANYIWNNYLGGQSSDRPFGDAELDGVDFEDETPGSGLTWKDLTIALFNVGQEQGRKIYISASPQCPPNDYYLDEAIKTGHVDYAWVRFFNNPDCEYTPDDTSGLFASWGYWSSLMGNNKLLMGLPSSPYVASGGYMQPEVLTTEVLPYIETFPNYGGIMVWTNFGVDNYTPMIKNISDIKLYSVE